MTDEPSDRSDKLSPSSFMRRFRPEYYSDTAESTAFELDAATLEYHLETITARNQTHELEIFCRKLCERTICPNLKPATGPEGGGDSKADTETFPVAAEIENLAYVGLANAGSERWAFAFSAKEKWTDKVRSDVKGIVETGRDYKKIFFITSRFARAKTRAGIEDELTQKYRIPITILDRTWIVDQVMSNDHKDLAFHYLDVGNEVSEAAVLGPSDYSRVRRLEELEKALSDANAFDGMEMQRATEALLAAKLSRNLERPRVETDGRFSRAVRIAEADGTFRQRLEAKYEWLWTAFWWFDDITKLNTEYDEFEQIALNADHARNLELLCNLNQLLFNAVTHGHLTVEEANLAERAARLSKRLTEMAGDMERPNHALEARTSLLILQLNQALHAGDRAAFSALWPKFSDVIQRAKGLGEFSVERLIKMIEVIGTVVGNEPGYARLVDDTAEFVSERTSEAQGALVLLKRARQLDLNEHFEIMRILGKAAHGLIKKEYADSFIEALRLLSLSYRSAGLPWAARASCISALATIFIEAEEDSYVPASVVPTLVLFAWICIELRHLPETLDAVRLIRGCSSGLPLDESSQQRAARRLEEIDVALASQLINLDEHELTRLSELPDVLMRLGFHFSRTSLLYALGYESTLRAEGSIPAEEAPKKVAELFDTLASKSTQGLPDRPLILNLADQQCFVARVLGIQIEAHHHGSDSEILAAEAVIGSVEAFFATAIDLGAKPHAEKFTVWVEERDTVQDPDFTLDEAQMTATVYWPLGRMPVQLRKQGGVASMLTALSGSILAATCFIEDFSDTLNRITDDDAVIRRIALLSSVGNSRQRGLGQAVSRLSDWTDLSDTSYPVQEVRPKIVRRTLTETDHRSDDLESPEGQFTLPRDHRQFRVHSVIDAHLWNQAGWTGTAFADFGPSRPPALALVFSSEKNAVEIFARWRERFGNEDCNEDIYVALVRGIDEKNPAFYRVMVTSRLPGEEASGSKPLSLITSRMNTMNAQSDENLTRFLSRFEELGEYYLVPAIWPGKGEPTFVFEGAIRKRELSVKFAAEVDKHDIESVAI